MPLYEAQTLIICATSQFVNMVKEIGQHSINAGGVNLKTVKRYAGSLGPQGSNEKNSSKMHKSLANGSRKED